MVDGSTMLRVPESVLMRKVHDEVVLLDMASEQYFGLDAVGACVIEAIQGGQDVDGVIVAVFEEFDAPEDIIRTDVLALVGELVASGLLVVSRA
jgi:hypothetical protein